MSKETFTCHGVEWFAGDKCSTCEQEAVDTAIDALAERIEIQITALKVLRERIAELDKKLQVVDKMARELMSDD